jgi:hypothetical protein
MGELGHFRNKEAVFEAIFERCALPLSAARKTDASLLQKPFETIC